MNPVVDYAEMAGKVQEQRFAPRRVLLVTAIVGAVIMGDSMLYNVLPSQVTAFGVPIGLVGVLLSANRFVRIASNPMAAWVFDRFGLDRPLLVAIVLSVGTTVAYGAGEGFAVLLVARILWGVCYSLLRLGGYLVVLEGSRETNRGRMMGFFSGGQRAGSVVGVLLGGLLFDLTGRATSFFIVAGLGLLSLPLPFALGRDESAGAEAAQATDRGIEYTAPSPHDSARGRSRLWDMLVSPVPELNRRRLHQLFAADFTFFSFHLVLNGVLVSTLGFYLNQELGDGVTVAGVLVGVATLNGVLLATDWIATMFAPFLGHLSDRFGRERVLLLAAPICLLGLGLLAYPVLLWLTLLWLPVAFVATAASLTSLDALVGGLAPLHRRAQVMSRYASWQDVGSAIGPLLAYAVIDFVSLTVVYVVGALLLSGAYALFIAAFKSTITREGV